MNRALPSPLEASSRSMKQAFIENPILPGFNPDPSILRVGEDYYIATSTFEWFPGVQIHHSRDLVHWRLLTRPLVRSEQLDLRGNPRSGGVWAPCLSYADGLFFLIYTDVKSWGFGFADHHNYLVTAETIEGPWSQPVYLNSSGFDPSLFHDDDGRKWLLNMQWDFRPDKNHFAGILLQEFDSKKKSLIGPVQNICKGSELGVTEGPHLYKKDGYYYLMLAEGGTSLEHAVTLARSKEIGGPYEFDPEGALLTSKGTDARLQKAGHASLVQVSDESWYIAHLCGRPIREGRCSLGRETALQEVKWTKDGWLRLAAGGTAPFDRVACPNVPPHPFPQDPVRDTFESDELPLAYQTLRVPPTEDWLSLSVRPGCLRLVGRESPNSLHRQSLVARRRQALNVRFETSVEFAPECFQQLAGLIAYYDDQSFMYLALTHDDEVGRCVNLILCEKGELTCPLDAPVAAPGDGAVLLRAEFEGGDVRFSWSPGAGTAFEPVGPVCDASKLSDEWTTAGLGFTGTLVGMAAHDLTGRKKHADFHYFDCEEAPDGP